MLNVLRRIAQEVNTAADLQQVLSILVCRIKEALKVEVCSVYLATSQENELILMATDGLNPKAVNKVRLQFSEGLVGLVAQRAEPIHFENAPAHPRYKYFPETGEERFHAFLGVPIMHKRRLLGVLVVQRHDERGFDDEHTAFLVTLAAQLASSISHAELSGEIDAIGLRSSHTEVRIAGVSGAPGVGMGTAMAFFSADLELIPDRKPKNVKSEIHAFKQAVRYAQSEMQQITSRMREHLPAAEHALFDAFVMMIGSETLVDETIKRIKKGNWAPGALRQTINEHVAIFQNMDDAYLRERADDIRAIGRRILKQLQSGDRNNNGQFPERTILIGEDVGIAELAEIPSGRLVGVVSGRGSRSSHVAILARALGVPAVMGTGYLPVSRLNGREIIVDGYAGQCYVEPSAAVREEFIQMQADERVLVQRLAGLEGEPAITPDGVKIPIYVNSGLLADINVVYKSVSDGIGLYRTEFPFLVRERFPTEDEQFEIYRQVLEAVTPRPVIMRTLDIGGDKILPYFPIKEDNPFLGWRGIRVTLDHPEIFLTQLRAMLRAGAGLSNLRVLFPMINSLNEVDGALALLHQAWRELLEENIEIDIPSAGVMIEVPSAVTLAEKIAQKVDFVSIGTNDLVQYILAVDRNNAQISGLYQPLHPAVLDALMTVVRGAHSAGKPVSVCGEMASDPAAVILLLGMDIDSLSVSLAGLTRVKWVIRSFALGSAREILARAMDLEDPIAIRQLLNNALVEAGLGSLVGVAKA
jgi:phosphotransferase system enzyme I (PtsP)